MDNKRLALLIDADNISAKYIGAILEELSTYGITTYKRIYGDFTSSHAGKWRGELLENSVCRYSSLAIPQARMLRIPH